MFSCEFCEVFKNTFFRAPLDDCFFILQVHQNNLITSVKVRLTLGLQRRNAFVFFFSFFFSIDSFFQGQNEFSKEFKWITNKDGDKSWSNHFLGAQKFLWENTWNHIPILLLFLLGLSKYFLSVMVILVASV